jgi:hypothetical protein
MFVPGHYYLCKSLEIPLMTVTERVIWAVSLMNCIWDEPSSNLFSGTLLRRPWFSWFSSSPPKGRQLRYIRSSMHYSSLLLTDLPAICQCCQQHDIVVKKQTNSMALGPQAKYTDWANVTVGEI